MPRGNLTTALAPIVFAGLLCAFLPAQQLPDQAPPPHRRPYSPYKEFHVDQNCRLLPDPLMPAPEKGKPHLRYDPVLCHLETVNRSEHMEEAVEGNEMHRTLVSIREQEYVMQNITGTQVIFVVHHFVPDGWVVDSDPQPTESAGREAIFRIYAQPGEIVRLHVGLRHAAPRKPRRIG